MRFPFRSKSKSKNLRPKTVRVQRAERLSTKRHDPNRPLIYLTVAMLAFGLLMIFSASAVIVYYEGKSPLHFFLLQIVWIVMGAILAYIAYRIPLRLLDKVSVLALVFSILLLILVLFIGKDLNGARRWIDLGPFDLQPSEIAKLGFVIYLSAWLSKTRKSISQTKDVLRSHFYNELLPFMVMLGIVGVLIVAQPDLDTALIIAITAMTMYFVSGKDRTHTLGALFVIVTTGLVGVAAAIAAPYRLLRVQTYLQFLFTGEVGDKQDAGFQVWNGLLAIGSGGLFGVGFGESVQKLYYLQNAAFTDSIFSIIAEEFGLVGSVAIIVGFLYFMSLGIGIARHAHDRFSALLALGITTWITVQAFANIGANLAIIPFGGIPLPFLSYGGSNTLMVMIGVGLLLNVSTQSTERRSRHVE